MIENAPRDRAFRVALTGTYVTTGVAGIARVGYLVADGGDATPTSSKRR